MPRFALSAIGRDRPGIVATVVEALVAHGVNVEDSQMAILRGHFSMVLIVAAPDDLDEARLLDDLDAARGALGLEAFSLAPVESIEDPGAGEPSHIVTVYGADHQGIVAAVTRALADRSVNITDLETRLLDQQDRPLYVMLLEVGLPADLDAAGLEAALADVAASQHVDVSVRPLDQDAL